MTEEEKTSGHSFRGRLQETAATVPEDTSPVEKTAPTVSEDTTPPSESAPQESSPSDSGESQQSSDD